MQSQPSQTRSQSEPRAHKDVFAIVERGEGQKAIFVRLGAAFVNKDGSLNVMLDALPVSGRLHIRDPKPEAGE